MVLLFVPCGVDSLRILEKEKQAVEKGERRGIGIGDESPRGKRQWWGAGKGCVAYYTHELTFYQVTFDQAPASCQEATHFIKRLSAMSEITVEKATAFATSQGGSRPCCVRSGASPHLQQTKLVMLSQNTYGKIMFREEE